MRSLARTLPPVTQLRQKPDQSRSHSTLGAPAGAAARQRSVSSAAASVGRRLGSGAKTTWAPAPAAASRRRSGVRRAPLGSAIQPVMRPSMRLASGSVLKCDRTGSRRLQDVRGRVKGRGRVGARVRVRVRVYSTLAC